MKSGIFVSFILLPTIFLITAIPLLAQPSTGPLILFSAFQDGQWDIFGVSPDGGDLRQLTDDAYEDTDPSISPDGTQLAYASRRNENWDIYVLDLRTGEETRLTNHPHYDGAPAWHPDGTQLAFESFRNGNLDVWLIDTAPGSAPRNLTSASPDGDFSPAWHSNGQTLFFTSWREGDNDLWAIDLATDTLSQLTTDSASDSEAIWDSAGDRLGFVRNSLGDKDIWFLDEAGAQYQHSWLGSLKRLTIAPGGKSIAGIYQGHGGAYLIRLDEGNPVPVYLTDAALLQGEICWHPAAILAGKPIDLITPPDPSPLYTEELTPSASPYGEPYDLVRVSNLTAAGDPWVADTVNDSYQAMRNYVRQEVGYDFLGDISEALRPLNFFSEASQYSSWHKSGRAVDTLFDLPGGRMEIVREDIGNETYWRIMLRCEDQSGRCGQPVTANTWDYSGKARVVLAPEQGGVEKPNESAYYVDFSTVAEMFGWERISSYDDEDFSWTWHFKAFEYWHYQKKLKDHNGVSNWYQAMLQVYPKDRVDKYFTWEQMRAADEDPYLVALKGVPLPADAERWWERLADGRQ